jgi:thiol-disulfide isomerase/thioredoxin
MNYEYRRGWYMPSALIVTTFLILVVVGYAGLIRNPNQSDSFLNEQVAEKDAGVINDVVIETTTEEGDAVVANESKRVSMEKPALVEGTSSDSSPMGNKPPWYSGPLLAGTAEVPLLEFNVKDYELANNSGKLIILYFYAEWCPLCRAEFPRMQSAFDVLPRISAVKVENVVGFRVNYKDGSTEAAEISLAKELGVAYQHTKVFLKSGERILKAPDTWEVERYVKEITSAL